MEYNGRDFGNGVIEMARIRKFFLNVILIYKINIKIQIPLIIRNLHSAGLSTGYPVKK